LYLSWVGEQKGGADAEREGGLDADVCEDGRGDEGEGGAGGGHRCLEQGQCCRGFPGCSLVGGFWRWGLLMVEVDALEILDEVMITLDAQGEEWSKLKHQRVTGCF
jgi:hypothetical protein